MDNKKSQLQAIFRLKSGATKSSEHQQPEEARRFFSAALEQSFAGIAISDLEGNLLFVNKAFASMHGYTSEELVGRHLSIFHNAEQLPAVEAANRHIQEIDEFSGEIWHVRRNGTVFPGLMHNSLLRDEAGNPAGMVGTLRDITERKHAEEVLRRSEKKFKDLIEITTDWVWEVDAQGVYTYASPKVKALLGYEVAEVLGKTPFDLMPEEEADKILKFFNEKVINKEPFYGLKNVNRHKDGHLVVLETNGIPIFDEKGELTGYRGIDRDITERAQVEEILRENEKKYLDLYQNAPDGYHSIGPDGTLLEVNDTWLRMLGYERDEVLGKMNFTELLTDDGLKIFRDTFSECKRKGSVENIEYELKRKDDKSFPALINATAIYDEEGNFLKSRSVARDNSAKKDYEKKLLRAAVEWRVTFDSMPYGVMLLDKEFNIIKTNEYISKLTGIPITELINKKCYEVIHGKDRPMEGCPLLKIGNAHSAEAVEFYETKFDKYFMGYVKPLLDKKVLTKKYMISLIDITEIKNKEKKLVESRDAFLNMLRDIDFSYKELRGLYEGLIHSFVSAIDAKSPWTKGHSERVTNYAMAIAKEMGIKEKDIETLKTAALFHDIGKIGTYNVILDKPGKLTDEEFDLVRMHPAKGEEILKPIKQLGKILPIIRHHHERVDGKGYPDGLKGEEIPFCARILHVADSFDSMTADRPYRPAPGIEYAISELKKCSGTQFDPKVVEAFLKVLEKS